MLNPWAGGDNVTGPGQGLRSAATSRLTCITGRPPTSAPACSPMAPAQFAVLPSPRGPTWRPPASTWFAAGRTRMEGVLSRGGRGCRLDDWTRCAARQSTRGAKGQTVEVITRYAWPRTASCRSDVTFVYAAAAEIVSPVQRGQIDTQRCRDFRKPGVTATSAAGARLTDLLVPGLRRPGWQFTSPGCSVTRVFDEAYPVVAQEVGRPASDSTARATPNRTRPPRPAPRYCVANGRAASAWTPGLLVCAAAGA
jgi:hypothetical protein